MEGVDEAAVNRVVFSTDYFSFEEDPRGEGFVRSGDEVLIVAVDEGGEVLGAVEPSAAFGEPTLLLPTGETEEGEALAETANRELQEELGFRAGQLDLLVEMRPWSKYLRVTTYVFVARGLTESRLPGDEGYDIGLERIPLVHFESLIEEGRLKDARVIAALHLARRFLKKEGPL